METVDLETSPIPTTPPSGSTGSVTKAMEGIAIIKAACDAGGLTTKYAKCALLGIIGVESRWLPVEELYNWGESSLKKMFKNVSDADAAHYARWKGRKQEFFGWLYGTRLKKPVAEGNYFGRGYIQLTFRDNYKNFSTKEYNLFDNPELMLTEDIAAKVAVEFIKRKVRNWKEEMNKPGFVFKVQKVINPYEKENSTNYKLKIKYYEYFYGGQAAPVPSDKDATNTSVNKTAKEIADAPQHKKEAYREERTTTSSVLGFCDPSGQYPLRDYMNEADTNRLARGVIAGTHIKYKDATRETKIPIANDGGTYDQPYSAYNTVYPYNKVYETESGHVMEFDDSPGGERINIYHRAGTFTEIDPNGTQVNFIVGDSFQVVERNGNIYISGTCNITTGSNCNILCQGDANVEVNGTTNAIFHNDTHIGIATDLNMVVGGNFNLKVDNNFNVQVGNTTSVRSKNLTSLESNNQLLLKTAKGIAIQGGNGDVDEDNKPNSSDISMKFNGNFSIETDGTYQIKAKDFIVDASNTVTLNGKNRLDLNPLEFKPLDNLGTKQKVTKWDGKETDIEEHVLVETNLNPVDRDKPEGEAEYDKKQIGPYKRKLSDMTAPEIKVSNSVDVENLMPPERHFDELARYETEEEWNTPEGIKSASKQFTGIEYNSTPVKEYESSPATGGSNGETSLDEDVQNAINNTTDFSNNYRLSPHFTLGMLVEPGVILRDTTLPYGKSDPGKTGERLYTKQELVSNLAALAINILEPIYTKLGAPSGKFGPQDRNGRWCINSGLRNGKNGSDHNKGRAVDLRLNPRVSHEKMLEFAKELEAILPYHQFLLEYRRPGAKGNETGAWQNWIHISYNTEGNQKMAFTMLDDKTANRNGFSLYG